MPMKVFQCSENVAKNVAGYLKTQVKKELGEWKVLDQIELWLLFSPLAETHHRQPHPHAVYAAVSGEDEKPWSYCGLITLSWNVGGDGYWWINDLVSIRRGTGGPLVDKAVTHAQANPGRDSDNRYLRLMSLDADSDSFWEHKGWIADKPADVHPRPYTRGIEVRGRERALSASTPSPPIVRTPSQSKAVTDAPPMNEE